VKTFTIDVMDTFWDDPTCSMVIDARPVIMGKDILTRARTIRIRFGFDSYLNDDEDVFFTHTTKNPKGWTRQALRTAIRQDYLRLERQDRLWGHDVTDLAIEGVKYDPKTKTFSLVIGS